MIDIKKAMEKLPPEAKQQVSDFIEFLLQKYDQDLILTEEERVLLKQAEKEYYNGQTRIIL